MVYNFTLLLYCIFFLCIHKDEDMTYTVTAEQQANSK